MNSKVPSACLRLLPLVFFVALLLLGLYTTVWAQRVEGLGWSQLFNLSNSLSSSLSAEITADPFGYLHVFWSEDMDGGPQPQGQNPSPGNGILYRSYRDGVWSKAVDIFYAGAGGRAWKPSAVADAQGFINLVWSQNDALMYSRAPIATASRPQAWSTPIVIELGPIFEAKLLENDGHLTVIYDVESGTGPGLYSVDIENGTPGNPFLIWPSPLGFKPQRVSATVDGNRRVHAVWEIVPAGDWQVAEVRYARSGVGGETWSSSRVVARTSSPETSVALAGPWIRAVGDSDIHIEWAQGALTYRWHQYSTDSGTSWSEPRQIWPDLVSQTNSKATGVDAAGQLYWVDVFRYPNGAHLTRWEHGDWQKPELFYLMQKDAFDPLGQRINVDSIRMTVSQGNELDIVFQDNDRGEIYFMKKVVEAVPVAAVQLPTISLTSTPTPTATPNSIAAQVQSTRIVPRTVLDADQPVQSPPDTLSMLLVSGGVALLFVSAIVFLKRWTALI